MADDSTAKKSKPLVSPTMIVLGVILVLAGASLIVDVVARKGAEGAYEAILEKLPSEADIEAGAEATPLTRADVKKLTGRDPDGPGDDRGSELVETFTWRGPLKRYQVFVVYRKGAEPMVLRATLNDPP
jgi:hypothetical protein